MITNGQKDDDHGERCNASGFHYDEHHDVFDGPQNSSRVTVIEKDPSKSASALNSEPNLYEKTADDPAPANNRETFDKPNLLKRLESIRAWGRNTIKCTKQVIEEKIGTSSPTCDENLDLRIESLRQMQKQYKTLLDLVKQYSAGYAKAVQGERQVAGQLAHLGQQQLELTGEFACNAEVHRSAVIRSEKLLAALDAFCDGLNTLINRTFEDTFLTIKQMHTARIEYDAYRKEAEAARASPVKSSRPDSPQAQRIEETVSRFIACEKNLNRLKHAVDAKLRLLHENRVRVMQHNLLLLHSSTSAYYSGDEERLDAVLKQFNIRLKSPNPSQSGSPVSHPQLSPQSYSKPTTGLSSTPPTGVPMAPARDSVSLNGFPPTAKEGKGAGASNKLLFAAT